ncbi:hypothetical protein, partial [Streptomyces sp. NPDC006334]|uniref:hypothetical protein n=1 Tax=Streptomyces sp. NPDC006334 TaxID=3156754 RepID=UPI0033A7E9D0
GNEAAFIAKMNATAKQLGMTNTTYTDASGLKFFGWWAEHRGDEQGSAWPWVWPAAGDGGAGEDDHAEPGPGAVHV